MRTGYETEDLVEEICKVIYLFDFVVRSPKYKRQSGQEKEAADFLVPFDDTLLAFQVKSKQEYKLARDKTENDFARIKSKAEKAIDQLKTINRAMKTGYLRELKNSVGILIPFDAKSISRLIGVVVLDLIGEEKFPSGERTDLLNGFTRKHDMPIHVFIRPVFEQISIEIDTLPDFIDYLEKREMLYSKKLIAPFTRELDLLAIHKTRYDLIEECLDGKYTTLAIPEGTWEQYRLKQRKNIAKRDFANRRSYIIDDVISSLRLSIGYDPEVETPMESSDYEQGSVENYWGMIVELSRYPRVLRRAIGDKLFEKAKKADEVGHGHSVIVTGKGSAILVMSSNRTRQSRVNALHNLCSAAYCGLGLRKIIGVATDPLSVTKRACDTVLIEDVKFDDEQDLIELFKKSFGQPIEEQANEWVE